MPSTDTFAAGATAVAPGQGGIAGIRLSGPAAEATGRSVVRGNHLLAAAGTLVSNPLTYLPLYWFNYLVGCELLGPSQAGTSLAELNRSSLWAQGWECSQRILLGSTVVGMVMAIASGWMAYHLFLRRGTRPVAKRSS